MSSRGPRYSGGAALLSLRFHQLAPKHARHWGGDPTIMDAYVGPFHGRGQALYLNLGRRQRKTLTNGFTAIVDRPVERNTLQACQWKGKHFMRQRLKWRKPGERLPGRDCALRVHCGEQQVYVKSVQMGMAYGFRGGVFEKFYVDRHTILEYVDEYGTVHQVPIRRGKDTSELIRDCVKIRGIHVQARKVSQFAKKIVRPPAIVYVDDEDQATAAFALMKLASPTGSSRSASPTGSSRSASPAGSSRSASPALTNGSETADSETTSRCETCVSEEPRFMIPTNDHPLPWGGKLVLCYPETGLPVLTRCKN